MTPSDTSSRPPRFRPQPSRPEGSKRWSTGDRRSSLVRSNAVYRKTGVITPPSEDVDFSYLPAHWRHTIEPSTMLGSSELRASLREARAKRNKDVASTNAITSHDNRQILPSPIEVNPPLQSKPAAIREENSTEIDTEVRKFNLTDIQPLRIIKTKQSPTSRVSEPNNENLDNVSQETSETTTTLHQNTQAQDARIKALEAELKEQKNLLRTLLEDDDVSDNSDADDKHFSAMAGELRSQLLDYKRLMSSLGSVLCTRRGVMLLKAMQHQQQEHPQLAKGGNGVDGFDDVMSLSEVADISQALDTRPHLLGPNSTCVRVCSVCNIPRFVKVLWDHTAPQAGRRSEFSSMYSTTQCCQEIICDSCFIPALVSSFINDWWFDQGYDGWIKCPIPHCRSFLPIYHQQQVRDLLPLLGDDKSILHEAQFAHCQKLRGALGQLFPRPTIDALQRAAALHRQLVSHGWMRDHNQMLNSDGINSLSLNLQALSVDSVDGTETFEVPVFVDNIIRKATRECVVCAESLADVADNDEDEERWAAAIEGFPGHWTHQIRPFPSPAILPACSVSHPLNVCRACLGQHITTQLDTRGIDACQSLSCPSLGCEHEYTHEEVRMLVPPHVFARYDRLKLLKALSTEPDFRWCLREGCGNGQIHQILDQLGDGPLDRRRNHIQCDKCRFDMCFKHQIPWHRGLSCAEYDRMKAGMAGNNNDEATQEWLLANTKMCRCGAYVEKQGGCFHMTCYSCRYEFCWECMADWKLIQELDPVTGQMRGYNRLAHAPDCWFRRETATRPTQLRGDTLEDALRWVQR